MNMDETHRKILEDDWGQADKFSKKWKIRLKEAYYSFVRPLYNLRLRKALRRFHIPHHLQSQIDSFLLDDGGMFKNYVYRRCNALVPLRGAAVLVPGVGFGRNLFQLAAWKPKIIVAFDLYRYDEEWSFLKKKIKNEFGVEVSFYEGGFGSLPESLKNYFDFIISDAVLEHVKDIPDFINQSRIFLKNDGIFYASFGPVWFGPCGDHLDWEGAEIFNHLLLSGEEHEKRIKEVFGESKIEADSCEGFFLLKEKLFSYLKVEDYLNLFLKAGFKKEIIYAKISSRALKLTKSGSPIFEELDRRQFPKFDRFCGGMYFWLRLKVEDK